MATRKKYLRLSDLIVSDLEKVKYLKHPVVAADEIGPHSITTIPPRFRESTVDVAVH
jgi:hypothetical protein